LPAGVPTGAFGPRLQAVLALLAGGYRLGKLPIRQLAHDRFGLSISTGMVAKLERATADALQRPMAELEEYIRVTVFHIAATRCGKVAGALLGSAYRHVVTSDRWKAYNGFRRRQYCWSHLRRDFQAMVDRNNAGSAIGAELLALSGQMLGWWKRVRDGTLTKITFCGPSACREGFSGAFPRRVAAGEFLRLRQDGGNVPRTAAWRGVAVFVHVRPWC
jgi:transposase